jgi:hypothetical protein
MSASFTRRRQNPHVDGRREANADGAPASCRLDRRHPAALYVAAAGSRRSSRLEGGARAPESASEEEVRPLSTKRLTGRKPKVTASLKGMRS